MSLILIVPEDGSIDSQEMQYLRVKKGGNIQASLQLYKDKFHAYAWDLTNPVLLNFRAKALKSSTVYRINKDKDSLDWDMTDAATGLVKLVLDNLDVAALITGDAGVFTGVAGDRLCVTIDSIEYDEIDVSACTTTAEVAAAINAAVGKVVATTNDDDYLVIGSTTASKDSNVTIADGSSTLATCVARLFSVAGSRTDTGATGDLNIAGTYYCEVEFQPNASSRVYKSADVILEIVEDVEG